MAAFWTEAAAPVCKMHCACYLVMERSTSFSGLNKSLVPVTEGHLGDLAFD